MNSYLEDFPVTPFVIVVDKSASMKENGGIDLINRYLPEMVATLTAIPEARERAAVGLMSFSQKAKIDRRILPLDQGFKVPDYKADGRTSYAAPLKELRSMIADDLPKLGSRGHRPIVFFITDGNPNFETPPEWRAARADLLADSFRLRPKLVTFGCGAIDRSTLEALASDPSLAEWERGPTTDALEEILDTVVGTITGFSTGEAGKMAQKGDGLVARIYEFDQYDIGENDVFEYQPA
jgi:uncharacterized protein YegL